MHVGDVAFSLQSFGALDVRTSCSVYVCVRVFIMLGKRKILGPTQDHESCRIRLLRVDPLHPAVEAL